MCLVKMIKNHIKEKKAKKIVMQMSTEEINSAIKIQSTEFDRKRKLDDAQRQMMRDEYNNGVSLKELSDKYGLTVNGVKYNVDDAYRVRFNARRGGGRYKDNHSGRTIFPDDLAQYKKMLVMSKKIKASDVVSK